MGRLGWGECSFNPLWLSESATIGASIASPIVSILLLVEVAFGAAIVAGLPKPI